MGIRDVKWQYRGLKVLGQKFNIYSTYQVKEESILEFETKIFVKVK